MKPTLLALALPLLAFVPTACSGGGGSAGSSTPTGGLHLLMDTASDSDTLLSGTLEGVVLETATGQLVPVTVDPPQPFVLAEPGGAACGVALPDAPHGEWASVHLVFAPGSLRARLGDGRERAVEPSGPGVRAMLTTRTHSGSEWIALRHERQLELEATGTTLRWRASLLGSAQDGQLVRDVEARIDRVDVPARLAWGILLSCGRMPVELHFADDAVLVRDADGESLPPDRFLSIIVPGSELRFDGILTGPGRVEVTAAVLRDRDDDRATGRKFEVEGRIGELSPTAESFRLDVGRVRKAAAGWPSPAPTALTVRAGKAKIKFVPRHGQHRGHLPFSSLALGMYVSVEGHGAPIADVIDADKVDIRSAGTTGLLVEVTGIIDAVRTQTSSVVLRAGDGDRLRIGDRQLVSLEARVTTGTLLVRQETGTRPRLIELAEVLVGERGMVLGRIEGPDRVTTALLRVFRR